MCIPTMTRVAPTISKLARLGHYITPSPQHVKTQRSFATFQCGLAGEGKGLVGRRPACPGNTPESFNSCPVLTYFSILSAFVAIVYLNSIHGTGGRGRKLPN